MPWAPAGLGMAGHHRPHGPDTSGPASDPLGGTRGAYLAVPDTSVPGHPHATMERHSSDRPAHGGRFPGPPTHATHPAARGGALDGGWHVRAAAASGRYGRYMHSRTARGHADGKPMARDGGGAAAPTPTRASRAWLGESLAKRAWGWVGAAAAAARSDGRYSPYSARAGARGRYAHTSP